MIIRKITLFIIVLTLFITSCENTIEKDDLTLIREEIEKELLIDMNDPDSYNFAELQVIDTVLVRDAYLHEIEKVNAEINTLDARRIVAESALSAEEEKIARDLSSLRNVFRVYSSGNELNLINEVISLFNNRGNWEPKLDQLYSYINNSAVMSYRYRDELPIFERIKNTANQPRTTPQSMYQDLINDLVEQRDLIQYNIDSNDERMSEIVFYRTLFSYREQNIFGGIQLLRKIYEVRFENDEIGILWASQKFDSSDYSIVELRNIPFSEGIKIIKEEIGIGI